MATALTASERQILLNRATDDSSHQSPTASPRGLSLGRAWAVTARGSGRRCSRLMRTIACWTRHWSAPLGLVDSTRGRGQGGLVDR